MSTPHEANARLNVSLRDLLPFFEAAGVQKHSLDLLNDLIVKSKQQDFLNLVESYGNSMALLSHDELVTKLTTSWGLYCDSLKAEGKAQLKKIKALKEDKKADPDVITRLENSFAEVGIKRANAVSSYMRCKAMCSISIEVFKKETNLDVKTAVERYTAERRAAAAAGGGSKK